MHDDPADVDAYLARQDAAVRAELAAVRARFLAVSEPGSEAIRYGMPAYRLASGRRAHFAAWAKHLSLHGVPVLRDDLEAQVAPHRSGKGTVRFTWRAGVPLGLIESILAELAST